MSHLTPAVVLEHIEVLSGALDRIDVQGNGIGAGEARAALQAIAAHLHAGSPVDYDALERNHKQDGWTGDEERAYRLGWEACDDTYRTCTDPT